MAINERLIHIAADAAGGGTGNQEEGLILHLDANDVDSYDGDGSVWYDITDHEYTPATNVDEHFNTVLYTGDGTNDSSKSITGVGFEPDLVWVKNRDTGSNHYVTDSVRGDNKHIYTESTSAENGNSVSVYGGLSIDTDGFTVNRGSNSSSVGTNANNDSYVAWCFKAGGAAVSNTDGSITSQVSASNDLGFSIVSYTGNLTNTTTANSTSVGHGLDVPPELIIFKNLSVSSNWQVFSSELANWSTRLVLNDTSSANDLYSSYPIANPTGDVFYTNYLTGQNVSSYDYIAYCFASKRGVSKVGSYSGISGSQKIYTGFEPAFVLIKKTNTSSNGDWSVFDNARVNGTVKGQLYPSQNYAESDRDGLISFNRDGFTLENNTVGQVHTNGDKYIYYAVAKNTKETDLIDDTDLELHLDAASFPQKGESGYSNTPSTWNDLVTSNSDSTITSCEFDSELGNFLNFNGSTSEVRLPSNLVGTDGIATTEIWVKGSSLSNPTNTDILYQNAQGGFYYVIFCYPSDGLTVRVANSGNTANREVKYSTSNFNSNDWYHIAVTFSGASNPIKLYVNGEKVGEANALSTFRVITDFANNVGSETNSDSLTWLGQIGQVRTYTATLTQDEIRQNYNFTKSSYPNGYNGTISGATHSDANASFDFDGGDQIKGSSTTQFAFTPESSLVVWFKTHSVSVNDGTYIVSNSDYISGHVRNWTFYHRLSNLYFDLQGTPNNLITLSSTLSANVWYFAVITYDGSNHKAYLSTTSQPTGTAVSDAYTGVPKKESYPLILATDGNGTSAFNGEIGYCKFYDKALSLSEVQAEWTNTESTYNT